MTEATLTIDTSALLAEIPLLRGLPPEIRALTERSFVPVRLAFGETVVQQGDAPDGFYVVVEGTARVVTVGEDGQEVALNLLHPGDAFGEVALLEGTPRTATVRASSDLVVLRLDRGVFLALADTYESVAQAARVSAHARRINDFLRVHSAFAVLPREATLELVDRLVGVELADGDVAVTEGETADALYLIQDGRLGVWIGGQRVRTLHAGEFFGELALLRNVPRAATVRAEGPVALLRLEAGDFKQLIATQPAFARRTAERVALYDARDRGCSARSPSHRPRASSTRSTRAWRSRRAARKRTSAPARPAPAGAGAASRSFARSTRWTAAPPARRCCAASSVTTSRPPRSDSRSAPTPRARRCGGSCAAATSSASTSGRSSPRPTGSISFPCPRSSTGRPTTGSSSTVSRAIASGSPTRAEACGRWRAPRWRRSGPDSRPWSGQPTGSPTLRAAA